jgi:hypothetical protein
MVAVPLGCAAPHVALAALGPAPFRVALGAAPDAAGNSITIRIDPRPVPPASHGQRFDLYVVQLLGFQRAAFLTDSGTWSSTPTSVRRSFVTGEFGPVTARWAEPRLGTVPVLVLGARPSSDPLVQANWVFRPVFRSVAVRRRLFDAPDPWSAVLVLVGLGVASAVAIGLVLAVARKPPLPQSSPASPDF